MVADARRDRKLIHDSAGHANCAVFGALAKFRAFDWCARVAEGERGCNFERGT